MTNGLARAQVGRRGERVAERFLWRRGYRVVVRNFRCPEGELDLVMRRGGTLVVVEVRTVTQSYWASPLDTIGQDKRARLRRATRRFLSLWRPPHHTLRTDFVGVRLGRWWSHVEWRKDAMASL